MAKQFVVSVLMCLVFIVGYGQKGKIEQDEKLADNKYDFCKSYLSAQTLLELGLQYNGYPDKMAIYLKDANLQASKAQELLTTLTPKLKSNLTEENLKYLNDLLGNIKKQCEKLHFNDSELMRLTLWLEITHQKELYYNLFPKILKP